MTKSKEKKDDGILANLVYNRIGSDENRPVLTIDAGVGDCITRTYRQLYENGNRLAAFMVDCGMRKGDRFAFFLRNHAEVVESLIAASISGCILVPIDPRTRGEKLAFMLNHSGCRGVLFADYNSEELRACLSRWQPEWALGVDMTEEQLEAAVIPNARSYATIQAREWPEIEVRCTSGSDPIEIIFTSGTTGDPKGILKPNGQFLMAGSFIPQVYGLNENDVLYSGLSLTHANAQFLNLAPALVHGSNGMRSVISLRFSKSRFWEIIRHHGCTYTNLLGGMTTALYAEPAKVDDADNPMRLVGCAGMPAVIWKEFAARFGVTLVEGFGAAEGGLYWNMGGPVGSFGNMQTNPVHESRIIDDAGNDVPPGEKGELIWRNRDGRPVRVDYLNNPEASGAKTEGGWFRTGDIVHADREGWLYFDYRKGGGIRRNGDFINPGFVEKVIAECDAIGDVFVYGVPATSGAPGEMDVVAAIVAATEGFDPRQIFTRCREKLEANFVPSYLQVVREIPKTASEKPLERILVELFNPEGTGVYAYHG